MTRVRLTDTGSELRRRVLVHRRLDLAAVLSAASLTADEARTLARLARAFEGFV